MADGAEKFTPRGVRNNNPGNIKKNNVRWLGLSEEQNDETFFQFTDAKYGIRALMKILLTYRFQHGLTNIWSIVERYAPSSENNTEAYKNYLVNETGYGMLQEIKFTIDDYLPVVKAIIVMENGTMPYDEETIIEGMKLAW
jgi:hypothetical protein